MNRTFLVTGATGAIGKCVVSNLCNQGHKIVALAKDACKLAHLKDEFNLLETVSLDLNDIDAIKEKAISIKKIDGIIHCAGVGMKYKNFKYYTPEQLSETININLLAPMTLTNLLLPELLLYKRSDVVVIGSLAADYLRSKNLPYNVSKSALYSFCKSLSFDHGRDGLKVSLISPSVVNAGLSQERFRNKNFTKELFNPNDLLTVQDVADKLLSCFLDDKRFKEIKIT